MTAVVLLGLGGCWVLADTAGAAGGPSSPIVTAGCLLGLAAWPAIIAPGLLLPARMKNPAVFVMFFLVLFALPLALGPSLPTLLRPIAVGRWGGSSTDPGIALSLIAVAAAMVTLVAFVTARFGTLGTTRTQDPTQEPSRGRRLGIVLGLAGLGLIAAAVVVARATRASDEAAIRRAFSRLVAATYSGPPADTAPLFLRPGVGTTLELQDAVATVECLQAGRRDRVEIIGIDRFVGRKGAATAFVTGVIGDDGGLFEADLVHTGAGAEAGPWRPTHVDVFHCGPGKWPPIRGLP
jgi:hypothetical protein